MSSRFRKAGIASSLSPKHDKSKKKSLSSSAMMQVNDFPSEDIILDINENMDVAGALDNSLLSEPQTSDFVR